ncbi:hypothetical protein DPMN_010966 [Dreissena polymorpha]|uniref:Uncharacterized protein n=1 Tax=Dreissena polymorpha TaxID=45954 RepID=A0A9D4MZN9_DREPO|nr:hypothetical protein DPMN_010966 [Dreissena polymorpha]
MLGVVNRMVAMVKSKSNKPGRRNIKHDTAWLKEAAKSLEMYQLVDRDWISSNIWRLPESSTERTGLRSNKGTDTKPDQTCCRQLGRKKSWITRMLTRTSCSHQLTATARSLRRLPRLLKSSPLTTERRKARVDPSSPTRSVLEIAPTMPKAKPMEVDTTVVTCSPTKDLTT